LVRPVTFIGDATPVLVPDAPPLLDVHDAEYERIVNPLSAPAVKATEIDALPRVTLVMVGGSGAAPGTTAADGKEALLVPTALVAVTVQVYVFALVRPVTVIGGVVPVLVPAAPPSSEVQLAAKLVIGLPLSAPAVKATVTDAFPRVTPVMVGAEGAAAGTTEAEAVDGALVPTALVAVTVQV